MRRAVIFNACSAKYFFKAARKSAASVKAQMPDVDTVFLTDCEDWKSEHFDRIVLRPRVEPIDVTFPTLSDFPEEYDSGIFAGSQKIFVNPVYDAFELVEDDRTDIALTFTSGRPTDETYFPAPSVPRAFPHFRSGFIAFRNHARVRAFFDLWREEFEKEKVEYADLRKHGMKQISHPDQSSLRKALYHSDLSIAVLRVNFLATLGAEVIRGDIRTITFPRGADPAKLAVEANRQAPHLRFFWQGKGKKL